MDKRYKVHITRFAYNQMREIRQYIEEELYSPEAAKKLLLDMRNVIGKLDYMPARYKLVENEPWKSEGIRHLIVKNFNIYYWIEESKGLVHVTAVVYGKRDQLRQLSKMDML